MNTRRKWVIALGASALGISLTTVAQTQKVHRVGILFAGRKSHPNLQAFVQELRKLGYTEGQNVLLVDRLADRHLERLPALAAELVAEKVDVIFAPITSAAQAARGATTSIPIVFAIVADPVGNGLVASLARPGGNITGTSNINVELSAKRLQVLKEIAPKTSRVAVLITDEPATSLVLEQVQQAAKRLGIAILTTQVRRRNDFESIHKLLRSSRVDALYVIDSVTNISNRRLLAEFAAQIRLPAIYANSQYAEAGGLISYGPYFADLYRRAAHYVDKILKGTKPADLPVELPTKFEMVINMKTAKALGIKVPQSILLQATRAIE